MKSGVLVNRVFIVLAIPLLAFLSFSTAKKAMEVYQLNQQAASIRQDIAQLKDRNAELRRQMEYVQSPEYVEKVAREQLNLVKPDDIPLVLVSPLVKVASGGPSPAPQPARPQDIPPNWKRWWNLFFGDGA
ncbi:MAG: septum formation initiator family protein [Dehalococcoidia bacterium]|nr:septum formation initiator family protein [Dehalococcoidia bacterium]